MIQISKPLTGGTGSVTTGEWESGNSYATSSQSSAIEDVLDALKTANIVKSFTKDDALDDTTKMSNRTIFYIQTSRKEAVDHVIDVVNLLDNKKVMPSS
tara:strand:+ start:417 stop:713 length:297 start_codon:yes stop_codon:yes gene_type:complete